MKVGPDTGLTRCCKSTSELAFILRGDTQSFHTDVHVFHNVKLHDAHGECRLPKVQADKQHHLGPTITQKAYDVTARLSNEIFVRNEIVGLLDQGLSIKNRQGTRPHAHLFAKLIIKPIITAGKVQIGKVRIQRLRRYWCTHRGIIPTPPQ